MQRECKSGVQRAVSASVQRGAKSKCSVQVQVERVQRASSSRVSAWNQVLECKVCLSAERASGVQQALTLWGELGAAPVQLLLVQRA